MAYSEKTGEVYDNPRLRAISALRTGVTHSEIARRVGWTTEQVSALAEAEGFKDESVRRMHRRASKTFAESYGKPSGDIESALKTLPPKIGGWLASITPTGSTAAETLVALATDTYHEEVGE